MHWIAWVACSWVGVRQDRRIHPGQRERLGELRRGVPDAELRRGFAGLLRRAAHQRDDLDVADRPDRLQVFLAECADSGEDAFMTLLRRSSDARQLSHFGFSRIRWPTAVFDAATW